MAKRKHHIKQDIVKAQKSAFHRFPLLFTLLAAFGGAATFAGIGGMMENIPWLSDNPIIALAAGLLILALTGQLYKKL